VVLILVVRNTGWHGLSLRRWGKGKWRGSGREMKIGWERGTGREIERWRRRGRGRGEGEEKERERNENRDRVMGKWRVMYGR
jgi:hypothetical protein